MKKFVLTFAVICLFSIGASAGWIHTTRNSTCDPATSEPGTCIWVDENNHRIAQPDDSNSVMTSIEIFLSLHNPVDYFLN